MGDFNEKKKHVELIGVLRRENKPLVLHLQFTGGFAVSFLILTSLFGKSESFVGFGYLIRKSLRAALCTDYFAISTFYLCCVDISINYGDSRSLQ